MAARISADERTRREAAIIAHLAKVPGLTTFELSRVLFRTSRPNSGYFTALLRNLEAAGRVRCETEPAPCKARIRRRWYPA